MLLGKAATEKLARSHLAIFGLGGVGSYALEGLVRAGVGAFDLFDHDTIAKSNLNRQLLATYPNIGAKKVDAAKERILQINPDCSVQTFPVFYLPENASEFDLSRYDYVIDAVDTVSAKLELVTRCQRLSVPLISCMGTGNKLDPTRLRVSDLAKTSVCPLARVMRRELARREIFHCKVVFSDEEPLSPLFSPDEGQNTRRATPGSVSFVPSVAGLIIAGEVIKDLTKK